MTFPASYATLSTYPEAVTGPDDGVADAALGSGTKVSYATEEASNNQNLVADPIHSNIDRPPTVQTENTGGAVESGKAECPRGGQAHPGVEPENIPKISQHVPEVLSLGAASDAGL